MLTFAGQPLLLEDPDGLLAAWLEQYFPLQDVRAFAPSAALLSERREHRTNSPVGCGLPRPNDPEPPRFKLNTLYWPTGASRWASFAGLVDSASLASITAELADGNLPLPLVLTDQDADLSLTVQMHLLEARDVTATVGDLGLSLLILVDERFFWQTINAGQYQVYLWNRPSGVSQTTWQNLFTTLGEALGVAIAADTVSAAYAWPDPVELNRPFENAAVLLDAVAHSVGQRIVRGFDGTVKSLSWSSSASLASANLALGTPLAGGNYSELGTAPATVQVAFQPYFEGAIDPRGQAYMAAGTGDTYTGGPAAESWIKTFHTTALADFSDAADLFSANQPQNAEEVLALAQQIAADYGASLNYRYDAGYPSLIAWTLSGYDDFVEFCFGRRQAIGESDEVCGRLGLHDRGAYQCYTRAACRPLNFGEEENLCQFADTPVYPNPTRFKLPPLENLSPLASPTPFGKFVSPCLHTTFDETITEWKDTLDELTVWDPYNSFVGLAGQYGHAWFNPDSTRWEIFEIDNRFLHGKLTSTLEAGGNAPVTIWKAAVAETATTLVVTAWDWVGNGLQAGAKVFVRWCVESNRWYVLSARLPILGKTLSDLANDKSSADNVRVYSVPSGESQGDEAEQNTTITAFNKFFGFIPKDTWVWCQDDGDGYYIAACERGDALVGYIDVTSSSGQRKLFVPTPGASGSWVEVQVRVQPSDQANIDEDSTLPAVNAAARARAYFESERVVLLWTGSIFTIVSGSFDGGVLCQNGVSVTGGSTVTKGGAFADGQLQVALDDPGTNPSYALIDTNGRLLTPFGDFPAGKRGWLSLNRFGGFATAAEC